MYAYPSYFSDDLISEIARNPKVCKYIDIPLQHISNLVLLAMNRPPKDYTVGLLKKVPRKERREYGRRWVALFNGGAGSSSTDVMF